MKLAATGRREENVISAANKKKFRAEMTNITAQDVLDGGAKRRIKEEIAHFAVRYAVARDTLGVEYMLPGKRTKCDGETKDKSGYR